MRKIGILLGLALVGCGGIAKDVHEKELADQKTALQAENQAALAQVTQQLDAAKADLATAQTAANAEKARADKATADLDAANQKLATVQTAAQAAVKAIDEAKALVKKDAKATAKLGEATTALAPLTAP